MPSEITEGQWLEGSYPGAEEEYMFEAERERVRYQCGTCRGTAKVEYEQPNFHTGDAEVVLQPCPTCGGCTCLPCESPAYGHPSYAHCAACCYNTGIGEYDLECPVEDHRILAKAQFGIEPLPENFKLPWPT